MGFLILAQAADPLGGWGSLLIQGGAFTLLAYVIIRLAPEELKNFREERESRDKHMKEKDDMLSKTVTGLGETYRQSIKEIATEFRMVNEKLVDHCDHEIERIIAAFTREHP